VSFSFISQLSESSLFPSKASLERYKAKQIAELTFLYLCGMRIAFLEEETSRWAREYARKTVSWGNFDQWRNNATDLYVLLHAIKPEQHEQGASWYPLNHKLVLGWLKEYAMRHPHDEQTRRLFVRLDFDLRISDVAMRSLRRMIMEWSTLESPDKKLALTRLHLMLRTRGQKSELLGQIKFLMDRELELREDAQTELPMALPQRRAPVPSPTSLGEPFADFYPSASVTKFWCHPKAGRIIEFNPKQSHTETAFTIMGFRKPPGTQVNGEYEKKVIVDVCKQGWVRGAYDDDGELALQGEPELCQAAARAIWNLSLTVNTVYIDPPNVEMGDLYSGKCYTGANLQRLLTGRAGSKLAAFREDATSGASCSSNVATVAGGLGAGFDARGDWGIYSKPKKKKDDKPIVLRRPPA
jgi:hypothetical protein